MPREFVLERKQFFHLPPREVFRFFSDPQNLEAITPAWLRFGIVQAPKELERGSLLVYRLQLFGLPVSWRTGICEWAPPRSFTDVQLSGPYSLWEHTHRLSPIAGGTEVYDHIRYRIPGGGAALLVQRLFVRRWLDEIFDYRRERLATLLGGSSVSNEA